MPARISFQMPIGVGNYDDAAWQSERLCINDVGLATKVTGSAASTFQCFWWQSTAASMEIVCAVTPYI